MLALLRGLLLIAALQICAGVAIGEISLPPIEMKIYSDGGVLLEGHHVSSAAVLQNRLNAIAQRKPKPELHIVLDNKAVSYDAVLNVMKLVQKADLRIGIVGSEAPAGR